MNEGQKSKREIIPNINLAMEQAVIAGLLTSLDAIFDVMGRLKADMFSDQRLQFVYRAILSLVESGTGVDMLTVENEMLRMDSSLYMQLNGLSFLTEMLLDVRTDSHIRIHADELVRCYTLRQLVNGIEADRLRFKGTLASDRVRLEQAQKELEHLELPSSGTIRP